MSSVTLEDYAQMRAEMDFGIRRDDVLSRAGIGADEWIEVQREWLEKMGAELDTGRFELTGRYSGAFLERQRTLTPKMPLAEPPLTDTADEASPQWALQRQRAQVYRCCRRWLFGSSDSVVNRESEGCHRVSAERDR